MNVLAKLAAGFALLLVAASTLRAERPNIVLIVSDDQAYSDFGFMGNRRVATPHLDRLAEQAAVFPKAYVPSSVCRPSLATLLTGLYPHQHGIHFNHPPPGFSRLTRDPSIGKDEFDALRRAATHLIRDVPTLPRLLASAGYRCLQTGKYWEGHWRNAGFTDGMTIAEPSGGAYGDKVLASGDVVAHGNGDHGLAIGRSTMQPIADFLDDCGDAPYFIWYAPFLPHTPHDSPERFVETYRETSLAAHERPYYAAISQFDATVGELLALVRQPSRSRQTLILFLVDNGWVPDPDRFSESRGEWDPLRTSKRAPFETGVRTPLLIEWNDRVPQGRHPGLVSSVDVMPTLLAAAEVEIPSGLPGRNLLPIATGREAGDEDRAVFGEIYPGDATVLGDPAGDVAYRWIRHRDWKLIVPQTARPWGDFIRRPALFHLGDDPQETNNLADDEACREIVADLQRRLDAWWRPE